MLAYEKPYLQIHVAEQPGLIRTVWFGFALSEEVREGMLEALRHVRENNVTRWLADYRQRRIITPEDQQWIADTFLPQLATAGLRRLAIVESENVFGRLSVTGPLSRASDHINWEIGYFDSPDEALRWLNEAA